MMNMDDKSTHLRSPLKALYHQRGRGFSDIVQLDQEINELLSSSIDDDDLDYDAFFSKYIDVDDNEQEEKFVINNLCGDQSQVKKENVNMMRQCERPTPKHHVTGSNINNIQTKKYSMSAAKLGELWIVDPKRAKRIMSNRQSAARSKERKARYISELERKLKSIQTEATALATQLNIYKDDAAHLAAENKELKLRLQTMEHQAQLQDEITEAMTGEVESLRFATGEIVPSSSVKLGMQPQFHRHLLPLQCSTRAADRRYTSQGLPPRLSCQPIVSHYWPSLHQQ